MLTQLDPAAPPARSAAPVVPLDRLILYTLIVVGFGVRVWHLGDQSLWLDEALSIVFSRTSLADVLATLVTQDLHPPLYYAALHFWMRLAGTSEFAARFLSVAFGLPVIPATYLLGASLFREKGARADRIDRGRLVGLIAATLTAVSPFLVYYSQEARMYSALATLGAFSSLALWRLLEAPSRRWWLAYAGFSAAVLYCQYFGGLIVGFQILILGGYWFRQRRRALVGFSALAATAIAYLPWVPGATQQIHRLVTIPDFWKGDFQLSYLLTHVFAAFALGQFAALGQYSGIAAVAAGLVLVGLAVLIWRAIRRGGGAIYVLTYLIVPTLVLYLIVARDPKFAERYLIMVAPPFYLVIALGLASAASWLRAVSPTTVRRAGYTALGAVGLALVLVSFAQIWQIYFGPTFRKDDNRGAIAYIEQHAQTGDVVVLMADTYQSYVYYARGDVPYVSFQPGGDIDYAAARLNQIVAGHQRLWLLSWNAEWADPSRYVRDTLAQAYTQVPDVEQFAGLGLALYNVDPAYRFSAKTVPSVADPINFGNKLLFLGYDLPATSIRAGQGNRITLYWQGMTTLNSDYIVSLRLRDPQFYWWRHDDRPAAYNFPTMYWRPGQVVTGDVQFQIPPGTPPGKYQLELGIYGQGQGTDLSVLRGGAVATGTSQTIAFITVTRPPTPPSTQSLGIPTAVHAQYDGGLRLLGEDLAAKPLARGDSVDLTLWWKADQAPLPNDRVRLTLTNGSFERLVADQAPASGQYPMSQWTNGEVVADRYRLTVPTDAPAGNLSLDLVVWDPADSMAVGSDRGASQAIGTIDVIDRQRITSLPPGIQTSTNVNFGNFASLVGSTLSTSAAKPGDHIGLTLYWQAKGNSGAVPYTVFAHLLDSTQAVKAQQDHQPGGGDNPTTGWTAGEYIVDRYDLVVAPDAKPGTYDAEVGMYNSSDGKRLPVADANGTTLGDRAIIGRVQIN